MFARITEVAVTDTQPIYAVNQSGCSAVVYAASCRLWVTAISYLIYALVTGYAALVRATSKAKMTLIVYLK